MAIFPLIILLAAVVYFSKPDERKRFLKEAVNRADDTFGSARRYWPKRLPFDDALDARTPKPVVALAIVALNVGIFICMLVSPGSFSNQETLIGWGSSFGPKTTNGEWWRLVTAMFVHTGLLHTLANVVGFVQIGLLTERLFGRLAIGNAYIAAGLLAGVVNLLLYPVSVSAGGSASVFAVYGLFAAAFMSGVAFPSELSIPPTTLLKLAPGAVFFLLYSLASGFAGPAEMTGLILGLVYGCVLIKDLSVQTPPPRRVAITSAAVVFMTVAACIPQRGLSDVRPEIEQLAVVEQKTSTSYDEAVRHFTNGQMTLKELVEVIDRSILPEFTAAQARIKKLQRVPYAQASLLAGANEYLTLREESWRARSAGLRRKSLGTMRPPDETERASLEVLDRIRPAVPVAAQ
jgi:membrane associated rhomboid family serine protease